jgi:hypothetical protein
MATISRRAAALHRPVSVRLPHRSQVRRSPSARKIDSLAQFVFPSPTPPALCSVSVLCFLSGELGESGELARRSLVSLGLAFPGNDKRVPRKWCRSPDSGLNRSPDFPSDGYRPQRAPPSVPLDFWREGAPRRTPTGLRISANVCTKATPAEHHRRAGHHHRVRHHSRAGPPARSVTALADKPASAAPSLPPRLVCRAVTR